MSSIYIILIFFTSLLFSLVIVPLLIRFAHSRQILDLPDGGHLSSNKNKLTESVGRRIHNQPIPRLGGIAIVLAFFISIFIWKMPKSLYPIYFISCAMFITGLIDDLRPLSAKLRLFIQIASSVLVVFLADLPIRTIAFTSQMGLQIPYIVGFIFSIFIIIGAINSINMIDGLDGLASGVVLIGICLLSYLHFLSTHDLNLLIVFTIPILGAVLGFLKYNTHPSSIFMGDSGSNWLGFMLGVFILLVINQNTIHIQNINEWQLVTVTQYRNGVQNYIPILSVLLCLSVPILDTAHVISLRMLEGKNPMFPDKRHFHHSLMKIGFTHSQSVIAVYFLMLVFGILSVLPVAYPQYTLGWTPLAGLFFLAFCIIFSQKLNQPMLENIMKNKEFITVEASYGPKVTKVLRYWEDINRYTVYIILLATPLFIGPMPKSIGYAAAVVSLIMCGTFFLKKEDQFFESFLIALASTVLLTANNTGTIWVQIFSQSYSLKSSYNALFIWLIISIFIFFILTFKRRYLLITPTDFLLILLPMILLILPQSLQVEYKLNIIALRALVLFAALRTLSKRHKKYFYKVHFICIISLAWVALTTLAGLTIIGKP